MAITLHGNGTIVTNASASSIAVTVPTVSNGDFMILCVSANAGQSWVTPSGWSFVRTTSGVGGNPKQTLYTRTASNEPASYTVSLASGTGSLAGQIRTYSGNTVVEDVDSGQGNASSTNDTAPGLTTANANEMVVGFWTWNTTETSLTLPAGFGNSASQVAVTPSFLSGDQIFSSAGATGNQTATASSTAAANAGQLIALKENPGDLSTAWFYHEWAYPRGSFIAASFAKFLLAAAPHFFDPTQRAVLGLQNALPNDLAANYWFSEWQPPPKFRDPFSRRELNLEHDDFQSQLFTLPSAPVGGWNVAADTTRNAAKPLLREVASSWEPFGGALIVPFQIPLEVSIYQLPTAIRLNATRRTPSDMPVFLPTPILAVDVGQFGQGNVTPQIPVPPRRRPLEDQPRTVVIDIGDLLPGKPWPASDQTPWAVVIRPPARVRDLVQPFDCSVFQPVQIPPMMPWDLGPAALPRALAVRRFYGDLAGNILIGIQPNPDQLGPWQTLWPGPARSFRGSPVQSPATSDSPMAFAVETAILLAWNVQQTFPIRPSRPVLFGDVTPLPKLPDANEAILGAWQFQSPMARFPIVQSARLAAAADPLRTWGLVAESMAWFQPWGDRPIIQARRQNVEAVGPGNFLTSGEAPYFWLWDSGQQVPVRYATNPARTHTTESLGALLAELPAGLVIVAGPYFVFAGQIYVAGVVEGSLSSE